MRTTMQRAFRPRPFEDGHALTFTLREVHDPARLCRSEAPASRRQAGEFLSQYHDQAAAAYAFALARKHGASYAELRDQDGRVIATYAWGQGTQWYTCAQGGAP